MSVNSLFDILRIFQQKRPFNMTNKSNYLGGKEYIYIYIAYTVRDEDPDPVGSGDFWPAGSGSGNFFNGSGSYL